jgi:hypothetical protein
MTTWPAADDEDYLAPRPCLREPIPEILEAAALLDEAANAHLAGQSALASRAIRRADIPCIRDWIESLWGKRALYPDKVHYLRIREVAGLAAKLPREARVVARQPDKITGLAVIERFGWNCAYCSIPLISRAARNALRLAYPDCLKWGPTNDHKHNAFMCMDNEFDHVIPHSRGGTNELSNLVPSCAPCNCGKEDWTLEQLGLIDPRFKGIQKSDWDGLIRLASNHSQL